MEQERIDKFLSALNSRYQARERFKISMYDEATVAELLKLCVERKVTNRGRSFVDGEESQMYISKAAKWLTGDHKVGLLLYGGVGNGKTTLASAIAMLLDMIYNSTNQEWGYKPPQSVTALDLAKIAINQEAYFEKLKSCDKLFIDDLGTEPSTVKSWGNEISPVTEILYNRYDNQLFTIVTSNLNDNEIKERYGIRIADRIEENFDKIYFSGSSYRKQ